MNAKIAEVLNSYLEYISAKTEEENRLQGILGQRKVYEKMLEENAFEYEGFKKQYEDFVSKLNFVLAEKLEEMPGNLHLEHVQPNARKGLAKLVFEFLGENYEVYSNTIVDTNLYDGETKDLSIMVEDFGSAAELLNIWLYYSSDLDKLKEILSEYKTNPEETKRALIEKFVLRQRQKVYDKIDEYSKKEEELRKELQIVDQILYSSIPLRESLLNKILYRDQIKLQQRQRKIVDEIEHVCICIEGYNEALYDGTFDQDCESLFNYDIEALEKMFALLTFLEERQATVGKFKARYEKPIFDKRTKITERVKHNETLEKMYIVRLDERKFAYRAYLQQLFKDEKLASAIMNLSRSDLDAEQWEAAKALKKFINKNHVFTA